MKPIRIRTYPKLPDRRTLLTLALALAWTVAAAWPLAAGSTTGDLPFNTGLKVILDNLEGPTGTALLLLAVIWGLVKWAGSERGSSGLVQAAKGAVALAIVVGLTKFLSGLGITAASL